MAARSNRRGYTLVELLIVIALVGLLATLLLPSLNPSIHDELASTAQVLVADLHYTRSLAVTNNSKYRVVLAPAENRYHLEHSGANSLLAALPPSPVRRLDDPPDKQICRLDDLPRTGPRVELLGARTTGSSARDLLEVEFGPLGSTSGAAETIIWLGCGHGENRRFLPVSVSPITGLAAIGEFTQQAPAVSQAIQPPGNISISLGD